MVAIQFSRSGCVQVLNRGVFGSCRTFNRSPRVWVVRTLVSRASPDYLEDPLHNPGGSSPSNPSWRKVNCGANGIAYQQLNGAGIFEIWTMKPTGGNKTCLSCTPYAKATLPGATCEPGGNVPVPVVNLKVACVRKVRSPPDDDRADRWPGRTGALPSLPDHMRCGSTGSGLIAGPTSGPGSTGLGKGTGGYVAGSGSGSLGGSLGSGSGLGVISLS